MKNKLLEERLEFQTDSLCAFNNLSYDLISRYNRTTIIFYLATFLSHLHAQILKKCAKKSFKIDFYGLIIASVQPASWETIANYLPAKEGKACAAGKSNSGK